MTGFPHILRQRFPMVNGHPDVAGVLRQPDLLAGLGPALAAPFRDAGITQIMAPEARGPILGALVAVELGAGLLLLRKSERNHPGADLRVTSMPTWRGHAESFQARSFDLGPSDVVLMVDDWITTGSTVDALTAIVGQVGATMVGVAAMVDKTTAATRRRLVADGLQIHSLVDFAELLNGDGLAGADCVHELDDRPLP